MDITSYLLGKKAGGGSQPPNLEEKSVKITTNTTTTISPGEGYDGLKSVEVTTNVASNYNVKISEVSRNYGDTFASIITEVDLANFNLTEFGNAFYKFVALTQVKNFGTLKPTDLTHCFEGCTSLVTAPEIDTSSCQWFGDFYRGCTRLQNVPVYNFASVVTYANNLRSMFYNCPQLTNESLNNIMASCITAPAAYGTKTLAEVGLTQTQAETCMTLSNYTAFTAAGWTTGY